MLSVIIINLKYPPYVSFLNLSSTSFDISLNTLVPWINLWHDDELLEKLLSFRGTFSLTFLKTPPI